MIKVSDFSIQRKVFYDRTDAGGVLYHADYLCFMDHARSEYLSHHGFEISELAAEDNVVFAVCKVDIRYRLPARLGDVLSISAEPIDTGRSKLIFKQTISKMDGQQKVVISEATVAIACLQADSFKPCSIPVKLKELIQGAN